MSEEKNKNNTFDSLGIFILGEINEASFKDFSKWILEQNANAIYKNLTVIINSYGGYCNDMFGIIEMIRGSKIPITTVGMGTVMSAGFMIFISGTHRIATPLTTFMCHQFTSGKYGKYHELVAQREEEDFITEKFEFLLRKFCNKELSDEEFNKLNGPTDYNITPEKMLELGYCEEIKYLN
jgi:ATP-dependent Clp protease protease subunit